MLNPDWSSVRLVVFDVDGTLYDPHPLRRRMAVDLLRHCLVSPREWGILRVIAQFRRSREVLAATGADRVFERQYARPAEALGLQPAEVQRVVETWMLERPLRYLRRCRFPAVDRFMGRLREGGKILAALSDYPTRRKLEALELRVDLQVSALDPEVDRLKPHPRGLERALELAGVTPGEALLIGDREDRDGECARRASVPYLIKARRATSREHFTDFDSLLRTL